MLTPCSTLALRAGTPCSLTADRVGAPCTLLGVQVAEAAQAIGKLVPGREALPGERLLAGSAHEALPVPRLLPVSDPSGGDGLRRQEGEGQFPAAQWPLLLAHFLSPSSCP